MTLYGLACRQYENGRNTEAYLPYQSEASFWTQQEQQGYFHVDGGMVIKFEETKHGARGFRVQFLPKNKY